MRRKWSESEGSHFREDKTDFRLAYLPLSLVPLAQRFSTAVPPEFPRSPRAHLMALLCSPSTTQPPEGSPRCKHLDTKLGPRGAQLRAAGGPQGPRRRSGKRPGRPAAPAGPRCPGDTAICAHLRREVSFSEHRSVIRAEFPAYPTVSVCMHEKV
uniref:Uncharacterized protein n=1 Tax=Myotis myotis TaxID=51298 RepID=A0A7J7U5D3_MYOMY|nr:hypothetical protein mMyoMyo1_008836 [Myotis myotis]